MTFPLKICQAMAECWALGGSQSEKNPRIYTIGDAPCAHPSHKSGIILSRTSRTEGHSGWSAKLERAGRTAHDRKEAV